MNGTNDIHIRHCASAAVLVAIGDGGGERSLAHTPRAVHVGEVKPRFRQQVAALVMLVVLTVAAGSGCSVRTFVASKVGDVLAEGGSAYATDDDIEFVGEAVPFGLKTMEGLLEEAPDHRPLLVATARGFVQYAYVYVDLPAQQAEPAAPDRARHLRLRAKGLYLRAHRYAVRALELEIPQFKRKLRTDPESTLAELHTRHVPELYWATVSLSAAIAADKQDMDLLADLHLVELMIQRALRLDEDFDDGAIHQFLIAFEAGRAGAMGGSIEQARVHFKRAMELADGRQIGPLVSLAESVSIRTQDRREFQALLQRALAFDVDTAPSNRLANLVAQKRARMLLARVDDFFVEGAQP